MQDFINTWSFSGELFYIKELDGEFAASVKVRGISRRKDAMSTQIAEMTCLMETMVYDTLIEKKIDLYQKIVVTGHIETWVTEKKTKVLYIADNIDKAE